ncbi:helix-turn-helix domain-containing protein [Bdellovibrio sp. 22V]|uniref:helix-turn-helix domain-containing protein n=1 Tax=Bdellovibrio sp. 22V TaxID=3044166 RepID=UPI0025432F51|nr:helix-turn-helix domain-containing protein [Bdellovibrio sp. 22V]WII72628.1 helix-turn-helix domain-containing protein [Bdellovibrio sp. 22V]
MKANSINKTLDIGEVVRLTGVPPSTLRYYEEKGLIRSTGRHGLRRLFNSHVLQQLEFIALGRHAGLSLEDIASMFTPEGKLQVNRGFLFEKADEMEKSIRKLTAVRNTLLHVAKCSAQNHMECPQFQRLLRVAGKRKVPTGKKV